MKLHTKLMLCIAAVVACSAAGYLLKERSPRANCAPASLHRLASLKGFEISERTFRKELGTTDSGTGLFDIAPAWKRLLPAQPLVAIYSISPDVLVDADYEISADEPLLWTGLHEQGSHACIMYLAGDVVILSHSQYIKGTKEYYTEYRDMRWLFDNTFVIYRVLEKNEHPQLKTIAEAFGY